MTKTLLQSPAILMLTTAAVVFGTAAYAQTQPAKPAKPAAAKPAHAAVKKPAKRDQSYAFVSTRPSEKVKNEVSMIVGYPQKPSVDATATVGSASYVMYTQNDGAWVKNAAEESQMVNAMRKGADLVVKSVSARGTKSTDIYALKGLEQALDKVAEECK